MLNINDLTMIITATIMGTLARIFTLKEDIRQYPSYPNGYLIHIVIGFVAAGLGAVAIPALLSKNYIAITFLVLAVQQFRDVRKMEKDSLLSLEETEYTYRGNAYIDGIAKTFEARNYFALIVALSVSFVIQILKSKLWLEVVISIIVGIVIIFLLTRFSKGKSVGDIADVKPGKIEIKDSELYVDGIFVSNILGSDNARKLYKEEGIAVVIYPKEDHFRVTLDHYGQRQAILFEATRALGLKRYHFTRKDYEKGRIVVTLVPIISDINRLIDSVKNTPLLESVQKSHSVMKTNLLRSE
ncbi:YIEGIA protein [Vulcanibacillus modesticaldus]|uniref:YIEGIA protein n=1 Tax=Vulcanibacillus modesticaldus TaxID=337097 RepID=A0A1D2YU33_9BACI|nr:YIEGIA domain-containing protein [Vulcanibacillus modesticaldus]OEF99220.1 YIEGIA protein [Vulcanibacillus modesticaldus]